MPYGLGTISEEIELQDCCPISPIVLPECASTLGIIPNLQCALDKHEEFTDYWDSVDTCDPDDPYLPQEDWYIDPEETGLNCT
jgi:hypothetical protein